MAKCNKIYRTIDKICAGSLNKSIIVHTRTIANKSASSVDFTEVFSNPQTVWAMIETVNGITIFDDVNQERVVTHNFYIRYIAGITSESWIEFDSRYFNILKVDALNEDKRFLKLMCEERGTKTVEATWL